ncbi:hypothetical protein JCM10213_004763 [Rhodosporidiobolus nylandii]
MLFTRFLPSLLFFGAALATPASGFERKPIEERGLVSGLLGQVGHDAQRTLSVALTNATTQLEALGCELNTALKDVDDLAVHEVVELVKPILEDVVGVVSVVGGTVLTVVHNVVKRDLSARSLDINSIAALIAGLLNVLFDKILAPLEAAIGKIPGLGDALQPLLAPLNSQLVALLNAVFGLAVGLLNTVPTLVASTGLPALLRALGLGPILSILTL